MPAEREEGEVISFFPEKRYGFISRGGRDRVFFHQSEVARAGLGTLEEGDRVSFTVERTDKGFSARNLQRAAGGGAPRQRTPAPGAALRVDTSTDFTFGPDYLREGYFERADGQAHLRPEVVDTLAMDVAKLLGNQGMKPHQMRRFFSKARGIETKLDRDRDFAAIRENILTFKRDVAYQVGRGVVPEAFKQFIDRNVELAVADERSFRRGFLQHFESVLAYFVYYFRDE